MFSGYLGGLRIPSSYIFFFHPSGSLVRGVCQKQAALQQTPQGVSDFSLWEMCEIWVCFRRWLATPLSLQVRSKRPQSLAMFFGLLASAMEAKTGDWRGRVRPGQPDFWRHSTETLQLNCFRQVDLFAGLKNTPEDSAERRATSTRACRCPAALIEWCIYFTKRDILTLRFWVSHPFSYHKCRCIR